MENKIEELSRVLNPITIFFIRKAISEGLIEPFPNNLGGGEIKEEKE
jgi:hypothetical protein